MVPRPLSDAARARRPAARQRAGRTRWRSHGLVSEPTPPDRRRMVDAAPLPSGRGRVRGARAERVAVAGGITVVLRGRFPERGSRGRDERVSRALASAPRRSRARACSLRPGRRAERHREPTADAHARRAAVPRRRCRRASDRLRESVGGSVPLHGLRRAPRGLAPPGERQSLDPLRCAGRGTADADGPAHARPLHRDVSLRDPGRLERLVPGARRALSRRGAAVPPARAAGAQRADGRQLGAGRAQLLSGPVRELLRARPRDRVGPPGTRRCGARPPSPGARLRRRGALHAALRRQRGGDSRALPRAATRALRRLSRRRARGARSRDRLLRSANRGRARRARPVERDRRDGAVRRLGARPLRRARRGTSRADRAPSGRGARGLLRLAPAAIARHRLDPRGAWSRSRGSGRGPGATLPRRRGGRAGRPPGARGLCAGRRVLSPGAARPRAGGFRREARSDGGRPHGLAERASVAADLRVRRGRCRGRRGWRPRAR